MESVWSVSIGSRELVANCVHTADANATKQFRRIDVGTVYWALDAETMDCSYPASECHHS